MSGPQVDLDEIAERAAEVNLGPWKPGVGIVHCIPALVAELRTARAALEAIADGFAKLADAGICPDCLGRRYITDDREHERRCPACGGSGRAA